MSSKGQSSVEFIVVLGLVLIVFIVMGIIIQQKIIKSSEFKAHTHSKRIIHSVAKNINEMVTVGSGYHKCFTLPGEIYGSRGYNLSFFTDNPMVFLETEDLTLSVPISAPNVSCEINPPCESFTTGKPIDVWVSNVDGVIVLADHGPCITDWIGII